MDRSALDTLDLSAIPDRAPGEDEILALVVIRRPDPQGDDPEPVGLPEAAAAFGLAVAEAVDTTPDRVHLVASFLNVESTPSTTAAELADQLAGEQTPDE